MKSKFSYLFILLFVISCSQENTTVGEDDLSSRTYFNEFMPCQAGPDYSAENMAKMIADWQPLITADQLIGVWGYAPASEKNLYPDTGWWELQWTSKKQRMLHGINGFKILRLLPGKKSMKMYWFVMGKLEMVLRASFP